jgi:starch synthase
MRGVKILNETIMPKKLNILFLSPEAVPFAKTGGLADVSGALPGALKRLGADVRLIIPFYRLVREGDFEIKPLLNDLEVPLGSERVRASVLETRTEERVPVYLIDREDMYDRPHLYGNAQGDYYDNLERYAFYSMAALHLSESLSFLPDVIHCHDWQTGLVPPLLKGSPSDTSPLKGTPSVFTIHNMGYQGIFTEEKLAITGLSREEFFHPEGLEYWGKISLLKSGIVYSEAITTVSPSYAQEIQTPEYGMGLEGMLQKRRAFLHGILNGIDYRIWDPARDKHLPVNYSLEDISGKVRCKEALLQEMNLDPSLKDRPLIGMISRLDTQKGLDILIQILDDILSLDTGIVILGSGDESIQQAIQETAANHPGRVSLFIGFNDPLAHRIMAGVDIFLIPSRYEPCGLTQMYALKYGTIPVVRATGGLNDTIIQFDGRTKKGNGFKFEPYDPSAFFEAIRQAVKLFKNSKVWKKVMTNGMNADFSWDRSAKSYMDLYQSVLKKDFRDR